MTTNDHTRHKCSKTIYGGGRSFHGSPCSKKATVERDGDWWCSVHDPVKVTDRREASYEKWQAESAKNTARAKIANAAQNMLETLKYIRDNSGERSIKDAATNAIKHVES